MSAPSWSRRRFLGTSVASFAGTELGLSGMIAPRSNSGSSSEWGSWSLKQVDAGDLSIGYAESGPADAPPAILLHGWPYDIHSFVDVAPLLANAGFRVIVPHLRGHGTTRFRSAAMVRNAQQSAVALDIVALMDALRIDRAVLAGYDWGARTANIIAALWPERCAGMVSANGYLINDLERNKRPLPPKAERGWWYQFYFATERGRAGFTAHRRDFARLIWRDNSPRWAFTDAEFDRTAESFENEDYVSIVLHNYRWRLGFAQGEARFDEIERYLASGPAITVPTITIDGDSDGVTPATDGKAYAAKFTGRRTHRVIAGAGHNLPQEAPDAFAAAVIDVAGYR